MVGRPDDTTGEAICAFVVLKRSRPTGDEAKKIANELRAWVAKEIGPIAKPKDIRFGDNLPKTRSGKIMRRLLRGVAKGGRDATTIFLQRNIGDALITFESEVVSVDREFGVGKVDAVHPPISIVAENPVAVVERTVAKKGSGDVARAYLNYLYSDEAQEIAAKHGIRPSNPKILAKYPARASPAPPP